MGEKETPTHSGRCIFYTVGIKMEPTRPTDSLVNHFYTTRVENASPTHVGGSFLNSLSSQNMVISLLSNKKAP